jgi:hypothetical protein
VCIHRKQLTYKVSSDSKEIFLLDPPPQFAPSYGKRFTFQNVLNVLNLRKWTHSRRLMYEVASHSVCFTLHVISVSPMNTIKHLEVAFSRTSQRLSSDVNPLVIRAAALQLMLQEVVIGYRFDQLVVLKVGFVQIGYWAV